MSRLLLTYRTIDNKVNTLEVHSGANLNELLRSMQMRRTPYELDIETDDLKRHVLEVYRSE